MSCDDRRSGTGASRRSNPATYTGLLDPIHKEFAKANGVKPPPFSPNSEGTCPTCNGAGVICTELGIMDTVTTTRGCARASDFRRWSWNTTSGAATSVRCWRCR